MKEKLQGHLYQLRIKATNVNVTNAIIRFWLITKAFKLINKERNTFISE